MNIVIVAFEAGRWGPARLPKALSEAGFRVFALCPNDNALAKTRFLARHFPLYDVKSSRTFERRLSEVIEECGPELIVPADERVVACLHAIVRRSEKAASGSVKRRQIDLIIRSLGDPRHFDDMMLKSATMRLARRVGVLTPLSQTVDTAAAARSAGRSMGFPVYAKVSFSWAGQGVTLCNTEADVGKVVQAATYRNPLGPARRAVRRWLSRDWYPVGSPIDVQKAVVGMPGMYSAAALDGRLLAGFAGVKQMTSYSGGPSSVVWLGENREMEEAVTTMIAALGASGLLSFDFMIEASSGRAFLIECNPRPGHVGHLGPRVGVDLCKALAHGLRGDAPFPTTLRPGGVTVPLFPQEWLRDPIAAAGLGKTLDIPRDDPALLNFMIVTNGGKLNEFAL